MIQIALTGHLGADAEMRKVGEQDVAGLRVAAKVGYGDRAVTVWWDVDVWGPPGAWAAELRRGEAVTVMGEMTARTYTPRDGGEERTAYGVRASSVVRHAGREDTAAGRSARQQRQPAPAPAPRPPARQQQQRSPSRARGGQEDW